MLQEHLALSFIDYYRRLNLWDIIIAFFTFKFHLEKDTSPCYVMVVRNQQFFLCIISSSRLNLWDIIVAFITFKFHLEKDKSLLCHGCSKSSKYINKPTYIGTSLVGVPL